MIRSGGLHVAHKIPGFQDYAISPVDKFDKESSIVFKKEFDFPDHRKLTFTQSSKTLTNS